MVFASERNEISKLIDSFAKEVKKLGLVTKEKLMLHLDGKKKPLIPQWHYPGCKNNDEEIVNNDSFSLIIDKSQILKELISWFNA